MQKKCKKKCHKLCRTKYHEEFFFVVFLGMTSRMTTSGVEAMALLQPGKLTFTRYVSCAQCAAAMQADK